MSDDLSTTKRSCREGRPEKGHGCSVEKRCGACQLLSMPYADQLSKKQKAIEDLFEEVAETDAASIEPIIGMDDPFYYRNKVISPYAPGRRLSAHSTRPERSAHKKRSGKGRIDRGRERSRHDREAHREILCGMYEKGSHRIIPTDECSIENQVAKRIILAIRDIMGKFRIEPYDEDSGQGFMRHAVVRVGHESGEVLVTLVTNGEEFPGAKRFCRELVDCVPEITTIVQNVNTRNTNVILGDGKERKLYGPGFILDKLCGLSFRISSHSFYQVNAIQTEVLYKTAIELAELKGGERILDAYCGTGTIGLVAARVFAEDGQTVNAHKSLVSEGVEAVSVIGVDKVSEAIRDARNNARHNGIENATFIAQDAGQFMREMASRGEKIDVMFMDPPRAGASDEFLQATARLRPKRIVYISCNPQTQVRDVKKLQGAGYRFISARPVDMFPHTEHIESIAVLEARSE